MSKSDFSLRVELLMGMGLWQRCMGRCAAFSTVGPAKGHDTVARWSDCGLASTLDNARWVKRWRRLADRLVEHKAETLLRVA